LIYFPLDFRINYIQTKDVIT